MDFYAVRFAGLRDDLAQIAAHWMREGNVAGNAVAKKSRDAPARAVEELSGHDDVRRCVLLLQRADCRGRDDPFDAEHFQRVDIGAEGQFRRQ